MKSWHFVQRRWRVWLLLLRQVLLLLLLPECCQGQGLEQSCLHRA